jgi:DNA-binding IclR family transcriptional regulator
MSSSSVLREVDVMPKAPSSSIVSKCAKVMDVLSVAKTPMQFSEVVEATGFVKSSCHRILAVLISEGLAEYDTANRTYRTGTRLHQWARSAWRRIDLQKLAGDEMLRLNDVTGLNAALSILDGNSILYLRTEDHVPIRLAARAGDHAPLHCTAAGKVFLAFAPPARRDELLGQITYDKYTEYTLTSRQQVERDLLLTQARGYGTALREEFLQITGMAAPVRDEKGDVIAAVSLWSLDRDASPEAVIARAGDLLDGVKRISQQIGWAPEEEEA